MLVDTHTHLVAEAFDEDRSAVIDRAVAAGVGAMVCIGDSLLASEAAIRLADERPEVWATVGIHPHQAANAPADFEESLRALLGHRRVIGLGEVGLDYHYDFAPVEVQKEVFRRQVRLAREVNLPLVIHNREADADVLQILGEEGAGLVRGVLHCFWSDLAVAERALDMGFYLGVGGPVTFKRSEEIRSVLAAVPLDRLLVETDAPYLAPVPHRGRRNEPAYVVETARVLAGVRGLTLEEIASVTTRNAHELFAVDLSSMGLPC